MDVTTVSIERQRPRKRETVLITCFDDGYIESYAEKHVDVKIVMVPYVDTANGEGLGQDYVEATLPRRYQDVFWPGKLRAADMHRCVRPSELQQPANDLALLQTLNNVAMPGKAMRRRRPADPHPAIARAIRHAVEYRRKENRKAVRP